MGADTLRVSRLILQDFRSYASADLTLSRPLVALAGENGAGKTNLIEALSLFTPGRGLRRVEQAEMLRRENGTAAASAAISVALDGPAGETRLGTGFEATPGRAARVCRIDGETVSSPVAFAEYLRVTWATPDLDGLFRGSPGDRRRFLDRLVLAVDSRHGARINALDRLSRQRNRLLDEGGAFGNPYGQDTWLDAVERELAETAVAASCARAETVARLDAECAAGRDEAAGFPFARLRLAGEFETMVDGLPALDAEDRYRAALRHNRARDAAAGRALGGPGASDLQVRHGPKDLAADLCSTGEQKALLLGLVLAHARLVHAMSGLPPLVLLDEVAAHLDPRRRAALFGILDELGFPVWMTGADPALFADLADRADCFLVREGRVERLTV